jgi:hypothetical protein
MDEAITHPVARIELHAQDEVCDGGRARIKRRRLRLEAIKALDSLGPHERVGDLLVLPADPE